MGHPDEEPTAWRRRSCGGQWGGGGRIRRRFEWLLVPKTLLRPACWSCSHPSLRTRVYCSCRPSVHYRAARTTTSQAPTQPVAASVGRPRAVAAPYARTMALLGPDLLPASDKSSPAPSQSSISGNPPAAKLCCTRRVRPPTHLLPQRGLPRRQWNYIWTKRLRTPKPPSQQPGKQPDPVPFVAQTRPLAEQ